MLSCPSLLPYNLTVLSHAPCHHYPQCTGKQTAALGRQVSFAGHQPTLAGVSHKLCRLNLSLLRNHQLRADCLQRFLLARSENQETAQLFSPLRFTSCR